MVKLFLVLLSFCFWSRVYGQAWQSDIGGGRYKNPVLYADYSDPDVIRVADDYYMVASSFTCMPGIPVLHSRDLVNWTIINHVYAALPLQRYEKPQHGQGSWAPSIRFHKGKFYVYFCTPQDGLFVATTSDPRGKWTLKLVLDVANWEDPCPFWDEDGHAYLLRGRVGAGPAILHRMSSDGSRLLDNGRLIFENVRTQPTLEGFKFMEKRDGFYYFSAPAGGVATGWQSVFRSKNIYGPYEDKIVLHQGNTSINGPHQGGFVQTQTGEWWFLHFQDKDAYGRIVHLQPVSWKNGWPVIGEDKDGDGTGEPVMQYRKPNIGKAYGPVAAQTSDEFNSSAIGLQWQWQAIAQKNWYSVNTAAGKIRLYAVASPSDNGSLFFAGNLLLQKFMAPSFTAVAKIDFHGDSEGERSGITLFGNYYTTLCVEKRNNGNFLVLYEGKYENRRYFVPVELTSEKAGAGTIWFRATVFDDATCSYSYSIDGKQYRAIGQRYKTEKGIWVGAKIGVYCLSPNVTQGKGFADVDFFRVE